MKTISQKEVQEIFSEMDSIIDALGKDMMYLGEGMVAATGEFVLFQINPNIYDFLTTFLRCKKLDPPDTYLVYQGEAYKNIEDIQDMFKNKLLKFSERDKDIKEKFEQILKRIKGLEEKERKTQLKELGNTHLTIFKKIKKMVNKKHDIIKREKYDNRLSH